MSRASTSFHNAIKSGNSQTVFLKFDDMFFDSEDIDVNTGITVNEYFNTEEDIAIGGCPCSTFSTKVFNEQGYITRDMLTEFKAWLGVQTSSSTETCDCFLKCVVGSDTIKVEIAYPYLYLNGTALSDQPSQRVVGVFIYKDSSNYQLFAIHTDGSATKYNYVSGAFVKQTYTISSFMKHKFLQWYGISVVFNNGVITRSSRSVVWNDISGVWDDYEDVTWDSLAGSLNSVVYECYPLGVFIPEKPSTTKDEITFTAKDRMSLFDVDGASIWSTFRNAAPAKTYKQMFDYLIGQIGVTTSSTTFTNQSWTPDPDILDDIQDITARQILSYLAQATGNVARFDRNGVLVLDWLESYSEITVDWVFSQEVAEYSSQQIGVFQLNNQNHSESYDSFFYEKIIDSTKAKYYIDYNPLMVLDANYQSLQTMGDPLATKLNAVATYNPSVHTITSDWTLKAGDIITIDGVSIPIFTQQITWKGSASSVIESSGTEGNVYTANESYNTNSRISLQTVTDYYDFTYTYGQDMAGGATKLFGFGNMITLAFYAMVVSTTQLKIHFDSSLAPTQVVYGVVGNIGKATPMVVQIDTSGNATIIHEGGLSLNDMIVGQVSWLKRT